MVKWNRVLNLSEVYKEGMYVIRRLSCIGDGHIIGGSVERAFKST